MSQQCPVSIVALLERVISICVMSPTMYLVFHFIKTNVRYCLPAEGENFEPRCWRHFCCSTEATCNALGRLIERPQSSDSNVMLGTVCSMHSVVETSAYVHRKIQQQEFFSSRIGKPSTHDSIKKIIFFKLQVRSCVEAIWINQSCQKSSGVTSRELTNILWSLRVTVYTALLTLSSSNFFFGTCDQLIKKRYPFGQGTMISERTSLCRRPFCRSNLKITLGQHTVAGGQKRYCLSSFCGDQRNGPSSVGRDVEISHA